MSSRNRLLLVDDDLDLAKSVQEVLEKREFDVTLAHNGQDALDKMEDHHFEVVLTDFQMPKMGGFELLAKVRKRHPRTPVIIMTAFGSMDRAIEATKQGAFDYLLKPFKMPNLFKVLGEAVATGKGKTADLNELKRGTDTIIAQSALMQAVFKDIGRFAGKCIPVMILGETGTGKELVSRAIHQHSERAGQPFVAVNCAAIPDTLIESELFGHERGAFTNALAQRIGRFEEASGGTLFLDEIGDLPPQTQVKLLRVLEQQSVRRVGGKSDFEVNVRILSATHRDLESMVSQGTFRQDLYFRLNAATIHLPALRERSTDIPQLVAHFLGKYADEFELPQPEIEAKALAVLSEFEWPGNVRQLENVMKKALIDSRGVVVTEKAIARVIREQQQHSSAAAVGPSALSIKAHVAQRLYEASQDGLAGVADILAQDVEREMYAQALKLCHGNQSRVANLLGVSRMTVRDKLDRYELLPKREV